MGMIKPWSEDEMKIAQEMYAQGKSYTEIGAALKRTRNGIAGLAHRLNFDRPKKIVEKKIPKKNKDVTPVTVAEVKKDIKIGAPPSDEGLKSLSDLGVNDCRWPFGEEDYTFCARPCLEGHPYCEEHFKLAYIPRRREGA